MAVYMHDFATKAYIDGSHTNKDDHGRENIHGTANANVTLERHLFRNARMHARLSVVRQ
jgi:hypothetical protein